MRKLQIILASLLYLSCHSQPALEYKKGNQSLLWEISGKDLKQPSYLYGTFHMLCKDDILISKQLETVFSKSSELYLELDLDDPKNTLGALSLMNMRDDTTIKDILAENEYLKLDSFFKDSLNMSIMMFQRMKPALLSTLLYPSMLDCNKMDGVENVLMAMAKKMNKPISGLETMSQQAAVFDSIPYRAQANDLLKMIDSFSLYKKQFVDLVTLYKKQDLDAMEKSFSEEPGFETQKEFLLDNRNKNWVVQLKEIMKAKHVFIAVGAGHLCGKNGLIQLLSNEGYTVKALNN